MLLYRQAPFAGFFVEASADLPLEAGHLFSMVVRAGDLESLRFTMEKAKLFYNDQTSTGALTMT